MSEAADRLARSRLAIVAQAQHRERRSERREAHASAAMGGDANDARRDGAGSESMGRSARKGWRATRAGGWLDGLRHVFDTWWRHHPAHMGVELATPVLAAYARRKPVQYLGVAAVVGAVFVIARPWRLISATGVLFALLKSSQLSGVMASAMAAAEFGRDADPYDD